MSPDSREYPTRPIVGVGAVIVVSPDDARRLGWTEPLTSDGVVLVRRKFAPLAGQWSLPGGAVEIGETLEAAVAREVLEEIGIAIEVGPIVEVFDRIQLDAEGRVQYHFVLIDFVCRAIDGAIGAQSDVADVLVADPGRLDPYQLTAKTLEVIHKAFTLPPCFRETTPGR